MPELPEVETTRRGISPHIEGRKVDQVIVRQPRLRWPVADDLPARLIGQTVLSVGRRAKYLLLNTEAGTLIIHLGMSGSLRIVDETANVAAHDHVDICLDSGLRLRYRDPRRFGALLWTRQEPLQHSLLKHLGPEPLSVEFDGDYLYQQAVNRSVSIKQFIMDGRVVVGVGNIYANEALFSAGIHPRRSAGRIGLVRYQRLAAMIKKILLEAIRVGGTSLRDFVNSDGNPGYFSQSLQVYGRAGGNCLKCQAKLREIRLGQRSTVYCSNCQH